MEKVQRNSIDKKQNELKYSKNDKSSTLLRRQRVRRKEEKSEYMDRSTAGTKKSPDGLTVAWAYRSSRSRYSPKLWMKYKRA